MRYVKFIKRLVVDEVPLLARDEVRYAQLDTLTPIAYSGDEVLMTDAVVQDIVVPVHRLCKATRDQRTGENHVDTTYIAYSEEVQKLLEMPFDVIKSELEACRAMGEVYRGRLSDVKNANLWTRIKYVFKQEEFL
jgi:hypothetical protein